MSNEANRLLTRYGPWAVVTGASEGIGEAFGRELAAAGFHLVIVARREQKLAALARELQERHRVEVRVAAIDLSQPPGVEALLAAVAGLDVGLAVAAAGFGTSGAFLESDLGRELAMLDVNCRAVAALSHAFGRRFAGRGRGGLVLMSSLVAFQGVPRAANYAATKAWVQSFAEGIAPELAERGVDVLAVAPGPVDSGFARVSDMRMGKAATPAAVAKGALAALGRRTIARPGWLAKLLELSLSFLPRWGRVRAMGKVMAGFTQHHPSGAGLG